MSRQEFMTLQKSSNVVWMPNTSTEEHALLPANHAKQTYYRSQAFTAYVGINPLIACAYPLLTLATRLCQTDEYQDLIHLYQMLLHEIKVFEHQTALHNYRPSSVTIACYLLCALIDETIIQTKWGKSWKNCSLLAALQHEEPCKERVFQIIDRLLQHPSQHLDVLELAYLCLSFNSNSQSNEFLEKLDKIYHSIREERGEISQGFLIQAPVPTQSELRKWRGRISPSFVMLISISIVTLVYYVFCYGLKLASAPLVQQLTLMGLSTFDFSTANLMLFSLGQIKGKQTLNGN